MNTFTKFALLVVAVVGLLVWVALAGLKGDMTTFKTISQLNQMGDQAMGKRLRVGGEVEKDSVIREGREVRFDPSRKSTLARRYLASDVAGYSRLMGLDEEGTLARLRAARKAAKSAEVFIN